MFRVVAHPDDRQVEAWSVDRLPFQPTGWARAMRDALRAELRRLDTGPGETLSARYVSRETALADAENVLLYNVGAGCLRLATRHGVRFERRFADPPDLPGPNGWAARHYHRYEISTPGLEPPAWRRVRRLASWAAVPCPQGWARSAASAWLVARRGASLDLALDPPPRYFAVRLVVTGEVLVASELKPILDGVIAALHGHDGSALETVAARIAAHLGKEEREVGRLLSAGGGALGERTLVRPYRGGVQWNPRDEDCVVGELIRAEGEEGPVTLSGEAWEVVATSAAGRSPTGSSTERH